MRIDKLREKSGKKNSPVLLGFFLLAVSFFLLIRLAFFCFSADIWYDEVFSVKMISRSFKEIVEFTARDVHPPLYYWYLKFFIQVGELISGGLTKEGVVILAKLASWLPMAGLWILAITKIRRQFGLFTGAIFSFCVCTMPQLTGYGIEIRMYSLALFLVTLAFLFAYDINVRRRKRDFAGLFCCGILVAYTQYFSCLGIVFLYLGTGWLIRKDKEALKKWLFCIGASVIAYLPWLGALIRQLARVSGSYWIPPLTWKSFGGCLKYIYLPSGGYPWLNYALAILLILATSILAGLFLRKGMSAGAIFRQEGGVLLLGWGMLGGVILIGVGVSILVSPVFVYRYMIPFLGAFWLVFALLLDKADKGPLRAVVFLLILTVGYINIRGVFWEEGNKNQNMSTTLQGLSRIGEEDVLIFNFNHVQAVVGYYQANDSYLLYQEPEQLIKEVYGNFRMLEDAAQIDELLEEHPEGTLWFLGSFNSREEIVEQWQSMGFAVTGEGSYLLERYWFNLYRLEKEKADR